MKDNILSFQRHDDSLKSNLIVYPFKILINPYQFQALSINLLLATNFLFKHQPSPGKNTGTDNIVGWLDRCRSSVLQLCPKTLVCTRYDVFLTHLDSKSIKHSYYMYRSYGKNNTHLSSDPIQISLALRGKSPSTVSACKKNKNRCKTLFQITTT